MTQVALQLLFHAATQHTRHISARLLIVGASPKELICDPFHCEPKKKAKNRTPKKTQKTEKAFCKPHRVEGLLDEIRDFFDRKQTPANRGHYRGGK